MTGKLDQKMFDRQREAKKGISGRCGFCGRDVELLFPFPITVNQKTYEKIIEITHKNGRAIQLISKNPCNSKISVKLDDFTMQPINGFAYNISMDFCRECLDKIGTRHQYGKKKKAKSLATKHL